MSTWSNLQLWINLQSWLCLRCLLKVSWDSTVGMQTAMRAAESVSTEECPVKMKLLAPPLYVLTTNTLDKTKGIETLTKACEAAMASIKARKGNFNIREAARAVSERDDRLLNDQVNTVNLQSKEHERVRRCRATRLTLSSRTDVLLGLTCLAQGPLSLSMSVL